jgi:hypothetical protein
VQERAAHGILSMFKAAEDKKIAEMAKQKKEQMQHASRREGLTIAIPDKDGAAERDCWVGICNTPSSAGGSTPSPRSRRSGGRTPRSSIGSTEGFDFEFLGSAVQVRTTLANPHCRRRTHTHTHTQTHTNTVLFDAVKENCDHGMAASRSVCIFFIPTMRRPEDSDSD